MKPMMNYNNTPILSVKSLNVTYNKYGSTIKALDNLKIEGINQGSWTFLTGSNGSGKSTLFKTITKDIVNYSGKIELLGIDIKKISFKRLAELVFLISQNPLACSVDELTVWENLLFATDNKSKEELENSLKESKLIKHKNHLAKNLSGGQRQLLALQIARLRNVKLLLLDEPFAALDYDNIQLATKLLVEINKSGTTIFFISHDTDFVNSMKSISSIISIDQLKVK